MFESRMSKYRSPLKDRSCRRDNNNNNNFKRITNSRNLINSRCNRHNKSTKCLVSIHRLFIAQRTHRSFILFRPQFKLHKISLFKISLIIRSKINVNPVNLIFLNNSLIFNKIPFNEPKSNRPKYLLRLKRGQLLSLFHLMRVLRVVQERIK